MAGPHRGGTATAAVTLLRVDARAPVGAMRAFVCLVPLLTLLIACDDTAHEPTPTPASTTSTTTTTTTTDPSQAELLDAQSQIRRLQEQTRQLRYCIDDIGLYLLSYHDVEQALEGLYQTQGQFPRDRWDAIREKHDRAASRFDSLLEICGEDTSALSIVIDMYFSQAGEMMGNQMNCLAAVQDPSYEC